MLYVGCRCMYCMVSYAMCGCICVMHTMCVDMVEEKELGDFRVWQPIPCAYEIRTKVEAKD